MNEARRFGMCYASGRVTEETGCPRRRKIQPNEKSETACARYARAEYSEKLIVSGLA